jgi:lactoylglutathione lyase
MSAIMQTWFFYFNRRFPMKFSWTTLTVSDLEKSIEFYTKVMGLGPVNRMGVPGHWVAMLGEEGATKLELICTGEPLPAGHGTSVSIGFAPDDLDAMVASLQAQNIPLVGPISPSPDIRFFFLNDPDGYTVQILQQYKGALQ